MQEEKLNFTIELSGTYWDKKPEYSIWIDDSQIERKIIPTESNELHTVLFSVSLVDGPHALKIRLENKVGTDTVLKDGNIVQDMLLNIESITVDDIDIGNLKWTLSYYQTDNTVFVDSENTNELKNCVNLGWNGAYILNFSCPYYLWLLENL
jgi:hypothetical protein